LAHLLGKEDASNFFAPCPTPKKKKDAASKLFFLLSTCKNRMPPDFYHQIFLFLATPLSEKRMPLVCLERMPVAFSL